MIAAVKAGAVSESSLALLEDRIALGQGKCQIYGTQIGYIESLKKITFYHSLTRPMWISLEGK